MSPDLRSARVYISVLGNETEREESLKALQSARGRLRGEIGRSLGLRYAPDLHFQLDTTIERGQRIEELLDEISHHRGEGDGEEE